MLKRFFLLIFVATSLLVATSVQASLVLKNEDYPYHFEMQYFEDVTQHASFQDIQKQTDWQPIDNFFSFGYTNSNHWLKLTLTNQSADTLRPLLWMNEVFFHIVDFYVPQADGRWELQSGGLQIPIEQRNAFDAYPHLQLNLAPDESQTLYIKLNGHFGVGAFLLSSQEYFYNYILTRSLFFAALIFALIVLSLSYLILHLYLKEITFVYYALYSLNYTVWIGIYNGFFAMYFNEWVHTGLQLVIPIAFIFMVKFSQSILNTPQYNPLLNKVLNGLIVLFALAAVTMLFDSQLGFYLHNLTVVFTMPLLLVISFMALPRKDLFVNLYVIALTVFFIGGTVMSVMALGLLPHNDYTRNAPFPGSVIEILLFGLILALKVFKIQDERKQAAQDVLDMQKGINERLEKEVTLRTSELKTALHKQKKVIENYSSFISLITHELRNPLGILKGQISLMRKEREKQIDHVESRLQTMASTTHRMEMLFDDWLVSDKIEKDLFSLNPEVIELAQWLASLENMIRQTYASHEFEFESQSGCIDADSVLLKLCLYNLIDNAVKYSAADSLVTVGISVNESTVQLWVEDQGVGVSEQEEQTIFERFIRGSQTNNAKGAGLGLSLVNSVMVLHQGRVFLQRPTSQGSRFVLQFNRIKKVG